MLCAVEEGEDGFTADLVTMAAAAWSDLLTSDPPSAKVSSHAAKPSYMPCYMPSDMSGAYVLAIHLVKRRVLMCQETLRAVCQQRLALSCNVLEGWG